MLDDSDYTADKGPVVTLIDHGRLSRSAHWFYTGSCWKQIDHVEGACREFLVRGLSAPASIPVDEAISRSLAIRSPSGIEYDPLGYPAGGLTVWIPSTMSFTMVIGFRLVSGFGLVQRKYRIAAGDGACSTTSWPHADVEPALWISGSHARVLEWLHRDDVLLGSLMLGGVADVEGSIPELSFVEGLSCLSALQRQIEPGLAEWLGSVMALLDI